MTDFILFHQYLRSCCMYSITHSLLLLVLPLLPHHYYKYCYCVIHRNFYWKQMLASFSYNFQHQHMLVVHHHQDQEQLHVVYSSSYLKRYFSSMPSMSLFPHRKCNSHGWIVDEKNCDFLREECWYTRILLTTFLKISSGTSVVMGRRMIVGERRNNNEMICISLRRRSSILIVLLLLFMLFFFFQVCC